MRVLVDQADITTTKLDDGGGASKLAPGQVRMALRRCALTANNITYAATGFIIGYWQFFPSGVDGQGLLPVWGTAEVVESRAEGLDPGTLLYGFWPLASDVVITPQRDKHGAIVDVAEHRAELPAVYNRYGEVKHGQPEQDDLRALLQPLLATSYLLMDFLQDNAFFEAEQVIIGSASSKTGLGLCKFLAELNPRPVKIVGLTGAGNKRYVESLGACDAVISYDDLDTLDLCPSVYVDMAGNADAKQRLHMHLDAHLKHSAAVGTSHWDKFQPQLKLAGPKPQFFFAPAQIAKRRDEWGPGVIEGKITEGWKRLAATASEWLDVKVHEGLEAAQIVYADVAAGRASPRDGNIIRL